MFLTRKQAIMTEKVDMVQSGQAHLTTIIQDQFNRIENELLVIQKALYSTVMEDTLKKSMGK